MTKQFECSIPTWAINYIYDGTEAGLSQEKIDLIDRWLDQIASKWVCFTLDRPENPPYFGIYNDIMGEYEDDVIDVILTVELER